METVVMIIMTLVAFAFLLKQSGLPLYGIIATALVLAIFVGFSCDYATGQSKTQIADWLENPELMRDMAVLLTIDVFFQISYCVIGAKRISGEKLNKPMYILWEICRWIPGILIFPVLFAVLVEAVFSLTGVDFDKIAWTFASIVFIAIPALSYGIKWLLPESDIRLELLFMVNALIAVLGVITTVNGRTAVAGTNHVEWLSLATILAIFAVGLLVGLLIYNRRLHRYLR